MTTPNEALLQQLVSAIDAIDDRCHECLGHDEHDVCDIPPKETYLDVIRSVMAALPVEQVEAHYAAGDVSMPVQPSAVEQEPVPSADGPTELWLQLHGDCLDYDLLEPVDYTNDEVTWCWHSIHDSDVRYVRADLVQPTAKVEPTAQLDDIHSCSFFCDLPACIKTQRDLLRDTLTKDAP